MRSNAKQCHSLIGFHSKPQGEGPKSPPGFPGPHGLMVRPERLRVVRIERKCHFLWERFKIQPCTRIALLSESPIWSLVCVSIRRFSTDELSTYNPASHWFAIGLRRLRRTFLKRSVYFLSDNNKKIVFNRIPGPLDSTECEKIPVANRISFKNAMGWPEITISRRLTGLLLVWDVLNRNFWKERVISYRTTSRWIFENNRWFPIRKHQEKCFQSNTRPARGDQNRRKATR